MLRRGRYLSLLLLLIGLLVACVFDNWDGLDRSGEEWESEDRGNVFATVEWKMTAELIEREGGR